MEQERMKTLVLELKEPLRYTSVRDLSNIFATINSLYNYYVLLSDPDVQKEIETKIHTSKAKDLKAFLFSSSLESAVPSRQRMNLLSISKASPMTVSFEGIGTAIDALRSLFEMFTPIYWTMKQLERRKAELEIRKLEIEISKEEINLQREQDRASEEHFAFVSRRINALDIPPELKQYLFDALARNMRSIELNPVKPMLAA